jgi:hypothetical protein
MGKSKAILEDTEINNALMQNALNRLANINELLLLHYPSDIRKQYSSTLENLGKVRNLSHSIINGYSSFNSVACRCLLQYLNTLYYQLCCQVYF